ncbi:hypothetical protein [Streptomyces liliifuscus]|uniref:Uncharacterized protein n=1 Tax=Streptomyces liliifuscus TaxID=2797636 RepID=A0A7T7RFY3_9ACTN|nr:hypothetical protein [Streptomyces liliifuscus]QQM45164.1 hypothetical protein JEQ17_41035 [Streptomyces liliifuscus]
MLKLFEKGDQVVVVECEERRWIGQTGTIADSEPHHIYGWRVSGIADGRLRFHSRQLRKA